MDRRLLELSQRPFPSLESPYFNNSWANMENYSPLVHDLGGSETNPTSQYRQPAEPVILPQLQAEQLGNTCTKGAPPPSSSTSPIPSGNNRFRNSLLNFYFQSAQLGKNRMLINYTLIKGKKKHSETDLD